MKSSASTNGQEKLFKIHFYVRKRIRRVSQRLRDHAEMSRATEASEFTERSSVQYGEDADAGQTEHTAGMSAMRAICFALGGKFQAELFAP